MDLPSITNAPRELPLGGAFFRARALTLADWGEVLAWLDDRLPPSEEGRGARLSAEASRLALATTEGLAVVLHLSLATCHPTLTRLEARALAAAMTPDDQHRLHAIAFRRRPSYEKDEGQGKDLAEIDWGPIVEGLAQHRAWVYPEVLRLTLDQYDNVVARGELAGPDDLDPRDVQRMWEEAMKTEAPEGETGPAPVRSPDPDAPPPEPDSVAALLAAAEAEGYTVAMVHDEEPPKAEDNP